MTDDHNKKPGDICQVGDELKVRIINIDEGRRRISFALEEAPSLKKLRLKNKNNKEAALRGGFFSAVNNFPVRLAAIMPASQEPPLPAAS